jgi:hypothetical protein
MQASNLYAASTDPKSSGSENIEAIKPVNIT